VPSLGENAAAGGCFPLIFSDPHSTVLKETYPSISAAELPRTITKDEVNDLPLIRYEGRIHVIGEAAELAGAVAELRKEGVLGFDTESRPAFRKGESYPPSLVQLAGSRGVYLFQLKRLGELGPLWELLGSPDVLKVGVAIRDDIIKLQEIKPLQEEGFIELSDITRRLDIANTGLRSLCAIFLGHRISKGSQVSNWARRDLTHNQVVYAATDAWVSLELYRRLEAMELL